LIAEDGEPVKAVNDGVNKEVAQLPEFAHVPVANSVACPATSEVTE